MEECSLKYLYTPSESGSLWESFFLTLLPQASGTLGASRHLTQLFLKYTDDAPPLFDGVQDAYFEHWKQISTESEKVSSGAGCCVIGMNGPRGQHQNLRFSLEVRQIAKHEPMHLAVQHCVNVTECHFQYLMCLLIWYEAAKSSIWAETTLPVVAMLICRQSV